MKHAASARPRRPLSSLLWAAALCLAGSATAASHEIRIQDYAFHPAELTVKVGDTVVWRNDEKRTSHSVLFLGRDIPESERFFPGESWQMHFTEPGEYLVGCGPHPEMRGKIIVESEL